MLEFNKQNSIMHSGIKELIIDDLQKKLLEAERRIHDFEERSRRGNLIFLGLERKDNEMAECELTVEQFMMEKLGLA